MKFVEGITCDANITGADGGSVGHVHDGEENRAYRAPDGRRLTIVGTKFGFNETARGFLSYYHTGDTLQLAGGLTARAVVSPNARGDLKPVGV